MVSADWGSYDISIPDGHKARYIYVYFMEVGAINGPVYDVTEIEAYPPFTFGKWCFIIIHMYIWLWKFRSNP